MNGGGGSEVIEGFSEKQLKHLDQVERGFGKEIGGAWLEKSRMVGYRVYVCIAYSNSETFRLQLIRAQAIPQFGGDS